MADPGFPVGAVDPLGGPGPPMRALFGENVCENERIGSHRGCARARPPRSANDEPSTKQQNFPTLSRKTPIGNKNYLRDTPLGIDLIL